MDPLTSDNKTKRPASEVRQCPALSLSLHDDYSCQTILSVTPHGPFCCKYAPVCQNYNAQCCKHCDTPTKMCTFSVRSMCLHNTCKREKKVFPRWRVKKKKKEKEKLPLKANQNANATTQWDERDRYEHNFPMRQPGHEWRLCVTYSMSWKQISACKSIHNFTKLWTFTSKIATITRWSTHLMLKKKLKRKEEVIEGMTGWQPEAQLSPSKKERDVDINRPPGKYLY